MLVRATICEQLWTPATCSHATSCWHLRINAGKTESGTCAGQSYLIKLLCEEVLVAPLFVEPQQVDAGHGKPASIWSAVIWAACRAAAAICIRRSWHRVLTVPPLEPPEIPAHIGACSSPCEAGQPQSHAPHGNSPQLRDTACCHRWHVTLIEPISIHSI